MRRSGKTTRAVDAAIQSLFNNGSIYVPTKSHIEENIKDNRSIKKDMNYIVDPDWDKGRAQDELLRSILKRLRSEHNFDIRNDMSFNVSERVITFKY